LAAILKILKTKSTTLSDDIFLCQVSNGSAVRFPFNIFCTLVTMATAAISNLFNPPKAATHYGGYSYKVSWSLLKRIQNTQPPIHVKTSNTFWLPWFISSTTLPQPRVYFSDSIDFSEIGDYLDMVRGR
jgi:hypothetical protein